MRLPDFIVGGAPRSGTTWLYALLDRHPGIYMARPVKPEPKFFLIDSLYAKGVDYYSRTWFGDAGGRVAGEKSTNYLESAAAAERIARDLPQVKLIFILRDPVARAYSNYLWTRMSGLESEDFATALRLEPERERTLPEPLKFARPYAYFSRGLYLEMLHPYAERFTREQMLLLRFENIPADPAGVASRVHEFLEVGARPDDAADLGVVNPSDADIAGESDQRIFDELRTRYREPNRRLAAAFGPEFSWE